MGMLPRFLRFLLAHPVPAVLAVLGVISIGSLVMDAHHVMELGLPVQDWVAIGLLMFFSSIIGILYQWWKENVDPTSAAIVQRIHNGALSQQASAQPRKETVAAQRQMPRPPSQGNRI
jgi:hypothetical protein